MKTGGRFLAIWKRFFLFSNTGIYDPPVSMKIFLFSAAFFDGVAKSRKTFVFRHAGARRPERPLFPPHGVGFVLRRYGNKKNILKFEAILYYGPAVTLHLARFFRIRPRSLFSTNITEEISMEKNTPQQVIEILRRGESLTPGEIAEEIAENTRKPRNPSRISDILRKFSNPEACDLGRFIHREKAGRTHRYHMVEAARSMPADKIYGLSIYRGKGKYSLQTAMDDYPALRRWVEAEPAETPEATTETETSPASDAQPGKPPAASKLNHLYVVGLGASAGGIDAMETFFRNTPPDTGLAFVVVSHRRPSNPDHLPRLISTYTKMKTLSLEDGVRLEADHVYIASSRSLLELRDGVARSRPKSNNRMPIDFFFKSLAKDQMDRAVGVVLSGMDMDGTAGLLAIKENGGLCVAQTPESAAYDPMPRSAINSGCTDLTLPPEKMAEQILTYIRHLETHIREKKTTDKLEKIFDPVFRILKNKTGQDFSKYKKSTIRRRLERRMGVVQIPEPKHYVSYLQQHPSEVDILFKDLLIGVTAFFRDPDAFEALKVVLMEKLLQNKPENEYLRIWVPGCASGEEAYSIAILLEEALDTLDKHVKTQVFGTDLNSDAIEVARSGQYPESIEEDVSKDRLRRFFEHQEGAYRVKDFLREKLVFAPHNIITDPPFSKLDLVCCRNLLIYLEGELQKRIVPMLHYALRPNGFLFLGASDTVGSFSNLFEIVDKKWKIYRRRDNDHERHTFLDFSLFPLKNKTGSPKKDAAKTESIDFPTKLRGALLTHVTPSGVLINSRGDIISVHGRTANYLELPEGDLASKSNNIFDMAKPGLKYELPAAVRRARTRQARVRFDGLRVRINDAVHRVSLNLVPLTEKDMEGLLLIAFTDRGPLEDTDARKEKKTAKTKQDRNQEVEEELQQTRKDLQTTVEELEASNEELKSTNEELQSANEELQSVNEELETSKEEQQSLNEELVTVNTELQSKIDQLARTNNDMRNLLDSLQIPTVFVDTRLRIKRFTARMSDIANILPTDLGRPLADISVNLEGIDLAEEAAGVLDRLSPREIEVRNRKQRWHLMKILPYRTLDNVIDGVVIAFIDIHEKKESMQASAHAQAYAETVVETMEMPVVVLDDEFNVVTANGGFYRLLDVMPKDAEGNSIYAVANYTLNTPALKELLESRLAENNPVTDLKMQTATEPPMTLRLNARRIPRRDSGKEKVVLTLSEITKPDK
jgi:two-component system CheB/CheR fusion protein